FFFSSRRRHTRSKRDWSSDVCSSDLNTGWGPLNSLATIGGFIFGGAQVLLFVNLFFSQRRGLPSGSNPWDGWTLEWSLPSPPPAHDFDTIPTIAEDGTYHFGNSPGLPNGAGYPN